MEIKQHYWTLMKATFVFGKLCPLCVCLYDRASSRVSIRALITSEGFTLMNSPKTNSLVQCGYKCYHNWGWSFNLGIFGGYL